jgi:tetratricopeptide (TPR) repeat protein
VDAAAYDLYLRSSPKSYAPDEMRASIALLEQVVQRAPDFAEAWGRLAFLRVFHRSYQPFATRAATTAQVSREIARATDIDPDNDDALMAAIWVIPPYGAFVESAAALQRLRNLPDGAGAKVWTGFYSRPFGFIRESLEDTERAYALDPLNPMAANALSLARMAAGKYDGVVTLLEDLMARNTNMSFAVANVMRAHAFSGNWAELDRLLDPARKLPLREFEDGLLFIQTKRDPSDANIQKMRERLLARCEATGGVEISQIVYAAHVGLAEDVFRLVETARLGPRGAPDDVLGPDAYRTGLLFWNGMPEIRNDARFVRLCARLGLVEFWLKTQKWPDCVDEVPYDFRSECAKARDTAKEPFRF